MAQAGALSRPRVAVPGGVLRVDPVAGEPGHPACGDQLAEGGALRQETDPAHDGPSVRAPLVLVRPGIRRRALQAGLEARTAEGWGRRLLRAFAGKSWRLSNIDAIYGAIYRGVGWLLFFYPLPQAWTMLRLLVVRS